MRFVRPHRVHAYVLPLREGHPPHGFKFITPRCFLGLHHRDHQPVVRRPVPRCTADFECRHAGVVRGDREASHADHAIEQ